MIWSSRARNRSLDPVIWCFFGRIAPSDAAQNHGSRRNGIQKAKLQGSEPSSPESAACPAVTIRLPEAVLASVEHWATSQKDQPPRSQAIRRLVEIGLKAK